MDAKEIILYLMKSGLTLGVLYGFYYFFLRKETFFAFNRVFLLGSLVLASLVPLIDFSSAPPEIQNINRFEFVAEGMDRVATVVTSPLPQQETNESYPWFYLLVSLYLAGWLLLTFFALRDVLRINRLRIINPNTRDGSIRIVDTPGIQSAFSLLNYIFISTGITNIHERKKILDHEKRHIKLLHTLDLVIVEFFVLLHWFNPFIYLLRNSLKEVHEYQADQVATQNPAEVIDYQQLLVRLVEERTSLALTSSFNSLTLKRLKMMNKNNSRKSKLLWTLVLLPALAVLILSFKQENVIGFTPVNDTTIVRSGNLESIESVFTDSGTSFHKFEFSEEKLNPDSVKFSMQFNSFDDVLVGYDDTLVPLNKFRETVLNSLDGLNVVLSNKKPWGISGDGIVLYHDNCEIRAEKYEIDPRTNTIELIGGNVTDRNAQVKHPPTIFPVQKGEKVRIASGFGKRIHPIYKVERMHHGVDITAPKGTPVFATAEGVVVKVEDTPKGFGKFIIINHDAVYSTLYAQLSEQLVKVGDEVKKGQEIGKVGNSGLSTGPHLHYEIKKNGKHVDPEEYFPPWKNRK